MDALIGSDALALMHSKMATVEVLWKGVIHTVPFYIPAFVQVLDYFALFPCVAANARFFANSVPPDGPE